MADKTASTEEKVEDKVAEVAKESPAKAKEPVETVDAPYPSQADLDAIKEGRFTVNAARAKRDMKAIDDKTGYKTR